MNPAFQPCLETETLDVVTNYLYGGTRHFAHRIQLLRCPVQTIEDVIARSPLGRVAFKALSAVRRLKHESERSRRSSVKGEEGEYGDNDGVSAQKQEARNE